MMRLLEGRGGAEDEDVAGVLADPVTEEHLKS